MQPWIEAAAHDLLAARFAKATQFNATLNMDPKKTQFQKDGEKTSKTCWVDGTFQNGIFQNRLFGQTGIFQNGIFQKESFRKGYFSKTGIFQNGSI
jgi:hypothetical protein